MRILLLSLFLALWSGLKAQTDSAFQSVKVRNEIYTTDFNTSKKKLYDYIKKNNIVVQSQNENKSYVEITIKLKDATYAAYDSLTNELGYSLSKNVNTVSNYTKYCETNLELKYLQEKKASYIELLKKFDPTTENYLTIWNEQKLIEEKIYNLERELINLNKEDAYIVSLVLNDEVTSPESTKVSFVNMPGFEYSYLSIESPKTGISAENYQGYFLKYLFTRGKSYGTIGVYKNSDISKTDTSAYSEMFLFGFGQDFYSRHLGRGSRKFLNLYSGYTVGDIIATGETSKTNILFIAPSVGLELYKNKFMLIDSKVTYFVPFKDNRNLRGFSYNISLNFVF